MWLGAWRKSRRWECEGKVIKGSQMICLIKGLIKLEDLLYLTFFISKHFYLGDFFSFLYWSSSGYRSVQFLGPALLLSKSTGIFALLKKVSHYTGKITFLMTSHFSHSLVNPKWFSIKTLWHHKISGMQLVFLLSEYYSDANNLRMCRLRLLITFPLICPGSTAPQTLDVATLLRCLLGHTIQPYLPAYQNNIRN